MKRDAKQWATDGMTACIPPGCPLPFTTVLSAKFTNKNAVNAHVKMFDGLSGVLEISQRELEMNCLSWCMCWKELEGGPINLNGTRWERVNKPVQLELGLAV